MYSLSSAQNQAIIIALVSGLLLALAIAMTYMMIWMPRKEEGEGGEEQPSLKRTWRAIPWMLIFSYAALFGFAIIYTISKIQLPPNW